MFGVFVFLVVFFVPETAYNRVPIEERFRGIALNNSDSEKPAADLEQQEVTPAEKTPAQIEASEKKEPYWRTLRLYTGTYCDTPLWKIMCRPFIVFFYPAVLWGFLVYGTTLTWIVVFSVVNASIFTLPPYNFSVSETGLISLSPFILTIIGEVIAGPLNDYLCLYLTKKNHGIYEPEFRLVLMSIVLLVGVTGFFGFGATVHYHTHWIGPVLTFGFANMALAFANGCVFGYVIDSYDYLSEEGLLLVLYC